MYSVWHIHLNNKTYYHLNNSNSNNNNSRSTPAFIIMPECSILFVFVIHIYFVCSFPLHSSLHIGSVRLKSRWRKDTPSSLLWAICMCAYCWNIYVLLTHLPNSHIHTHSLASLPLSLSLCLSSVIIIIFLFSEILYDSICAFLCAVVTLSMCVHVLRFIIRQMLMKQTKKATTTNNTNVYMSTQTPCSNGTTTLPYRRKICRIHIGMLRGIEPLFGMKKSSIASEIAEMKEWREEKKIIINDDDDGNTATTILCVLYVRVTMCSVYKSYAVLSVYSSDLIFFSLSASSCKRFVSLVVCNCQRIRTWIQQ